VAASPLNKMDLATLRARIQDLSNDLWWTWNPECQRVFAALDPAIWKASHHSPLVTLQVASPARMEALCDDAEFLALLEQAENDRRDYYRSKTWFQRTATAKQKRMKIAYFCSEFAIHESIPQYSGGLGVLAGDHMKSASDLGLPLVGVGLLYQHGYYRQELRADGSTRVLYPQYPAAILPITDTGVEIDCPMGSRFVRAKIWRQQVGRTSIYLLDTQLKCNRPADRLLTEGLYKGEPELRMRQQLLLGVGGVLALDALAIKPTVCHLNEGHAAFANLQRIRVWMAKGWSFERALKKVRGETVFTTHTPVPAGHDRYPAKMVAKWLRPIAADLGCNAQQLADLGREKPGEKNEDLCMTVLALRTSERINGVASLHGEVSRKMWMDAYGLDDARKVPIGHITNGVHSQTWLAPAAAELYRKTLRPKWNGAGPSAPWWQRVDRISDEQLWDLRSGLRAQLVQFLRERGAEQVQKRGGSAAEVMQAMQAFEEHSLTLGFARRFATYKRAPLIFRDAKRLMNILGDGERPMQLVFAGKAHPRDEAGQEFVQRIHKLAQREGFRGRVILLEEYDMEIGRMLTSGCDVWLNTPLRPHEASGTSGMKPPLHGGLNCSILDGWWPEGYNRRNGWVIGDEREYASRTTQDRVDATSLYELLENEIGPAFYTRGRNGLPRKWLKLMRESMKSVPEQFSSHRMVAEYLKLYSG
jgi:glycogen phosphorylase